MTDDPYLYPGSQVLRNKLGLKDAAALDRAERLAATVRARSGIPSGDFDLQHLQAIHRHLFQDVYDWAGEVRTVGIAKGGNQFMPVPLIARGMADIHRRLSEARYHEGSTLDGFAAAAGPIMGDVNHVHPFREGNGRTQLLYFKQLAERAGHRLDLRHINGPSWLMASKAAHWGDYQPMTNAIHEALQNSASRSHELVRQPGEGRLAEKLSKAKKTEHTRTGADTKGRGR